MPKLAGLMDEAEGDVLALIAFPTISLPALAACAAAIWVVAASIRMGDAGVGRRA